MASDVEFHYNRGVTVRLCEMSQYEKYHIYDHIVVSSDKSLLFVLKRLCDMSKIKSFPLNIEQSHPGMSLIIKRPEPRYYQDVT